jgi:hypothetical protein
MAEATSDPELRRCRRYGCRHEARDHGFMDGKLACFRCAVGRREHAFTVSDAPRK